MELDPLVVPPLVKCLAEESHGDPLSWLVADDHVTIVYTDGRKIRYDREADQLAKPTPVRAAATHTRTRARTGK
jgi:hypothetical protein